MKFPQFLMHSMISFSTCWLPLYGLDQYPSSEEASLYHHHSQQQWSVAYEALNNVSFQGDERVLDIGCGSGKVTANIAGRVLKGSVLGLDLSQGMIEFAQKKYLPFYKNLSFTKGDVLEFTSPSQFDFIFSSNSLHWILDHQSLLNKVYDLLSDDGTILFTIPCPPFPDVAAVFQEVTSQDIWKDYLKNYNHPRRKFTSEEYTLLLKQAGFNKIEVTQVPFTYFFETKRELADWYAGFSPMLSYIPKEMCESFLINIVERYIQSFPLDETGRVVFKQNELIIKAQK